MTASIDDIREWCQEDIQFSVLFLIVLILILILIVLNVHTVLYLFFVQGYLSVPLSLKVFYYLIAFMSID